MKTSRMKRTYLFLPPDLLSETDALVQKLRGRVEGQNIGLRPSAVSRAAILRAAVEAGLKAIDEKGGFHMENPNNKEDI